MVAVGAWNFDEACEVEFFLFGFGGTVSEMMKRIYSHEWLLQQEDLLSPKRNAGVWDFSFFNMSKTGKTEIPPFNRDAR